MALMPACRFAGSARFTTSAAREFLSPTYDYYLDWLRKSPLLSALLNVRQIPSEPIAFADS